MINNSGKEMNEVCIKECGQEIIMKLRMICVQPQMEYVQVYIWMCIKLVEQITVKVAIYGSEKFKLVTH